MKYNVLIVEDEILIANHLKQMVSVNYKCIGVASSFMEALPLLSSADIVLLDIKLRGDKTGIDIATYINRKCKIPFIFLTAFSDQETLQTIVKLEAAAYLVKPIIKSNLEAAMSLAIQKSSTSKYVIKAGKKSLLIDLTDLIFVEADHVYIFLHMIKGERNILRISLTKFLSELPKPLIVRVNRSQAVNIKRITKINCDKLFLGDKQFVISSAYKEFFKNLQL